MKSFALLLALLVLSALLPSQGHGTVNVHLKDGNVRRGEIIEQTSSRIRLDTGDGNIYAFQISQIEKIVKEVPLEIDVLHLHKGSIIRGKVVEEMEDRLKIRTAGGNIEAFFKSEIKSRLKDTEVSYETWIPPETSTQPPTVIIRDRKSPGLALVLSMFVLPGSGQWYNGEVGNGFFFFGTSIIGMVLVIQGVEESTQYDPFTGRQYVSEEPGSKFGLGMLMILTSSIWGGIDAYKTAKRINRESGYTLWEGEKGRAIALSLSPSLKPDSDTGAKLALKIDF